MFHCVLLGLGARKFRKQAVDCGDRSVWTDTPSDKNKKQVFFKADLHNESVQNKIVLCKWLNNLKHATYNLWHILSNSQAIGMMYQVTPCHMPQVTLCKSTFRIPYQL